MHHTEPMLATVVTNPTDKSLRYTWLGKNGTYVNGGCSVTVPYDVYTAATPVQRKQLAAAVNSKMVELKYLISGVATEKIEKIDNRIVHGEVVEKAKKAAAVRKPINNDEPTTEPGPKRDKIINPVEETEGESKLKAAEDLVQKATGQKTVTMRDAMGWKEPETADPRKPQEVTDIDMEEALTENVGDPLAKLAAAEAKKKAKAEADAKRAKATKKSKGVDPKKSAAAKKAAETRKANAAKKAAEAKKK